MAVGSRTLISIVAVLVAATVAFFLYAMYAYTNSSCYAGMHKAGQDREIAELFDTVGDIVTGLRKGTGETSKWDDPEFQNEVKGASHLLAEGRLALKNRDAFAALDAMVELTNTLVRAKTLATNRVNHILKIQNPADYDAFEKYRLEGKNLVGIVKRINAALLALSDGPKKLPEACIW